MKVVSTLTAFADPAMIDSIFPDEQLIDATGTVLPGDLAEPARLRRSAAARPADVRLGTRGARWVRRPEKAACQSRLTLSIKFHTPAPPRNTRRRFFWAAARPHRIAFVQRPG